MSVGSAYREYRAAMDVAYGALRGCEAYPEAGTPESDRLEALFRRR
jgi:hypothetical protein